MSYDALGNIAAWLALFGALELVAFIVGASPYEFMRNAGQWTVSAAVVLMVVRYVARRLGCI